MAHHIFRLESELLRVADYPGSGIHRVLFNFLAQIRTQTSVEDVNFNATYRIREGEDAAVLNYPIFVDVAPPETGWSSAVSRSTFGTTPTRAFSTC
jgi:hypothetical protein